MPMQLGAHNVADLGCHRLELCWPVPVLAKENVLVLRPDRLLHPADVADHPVEMLFHQAAHAERNGLRAWAQALLSERIAIRRLQVLQDKARIGDLLATV